MGNMLIFGLGYTAQHLADRLRAEGWQVTGTKREAADGAIAFDDQAAVLAAIGAASHILSSVPPARDGNEPVLDHYGAAIKAASLQWTGYLSSTGVYGDTDGGSPMVRQSGSWVGSHNILIINPEWRQF